MQSRNLHWAGSAQRQAKVKASIINYSAALSACDKGRKWQLALGLLSTMAQAKVEASIISYSAAVSARDTGT